MLAQLVYIIILLHDLYHETACQERLAKKLLFSISALALRPLLVTHMRDMPIGRKTLHVSGRFVFHEALGLFLTCSLEFSLSTMLSFEVFR